jgi:hypothetical protein
MKFNPDAKLPDHTSMSTVARQIATTQNNTKLEVDWQSGSFRPPEGPALEAINQIAGLLVGSNCVCRNNKSGQGF